MDRQIGDEIYILQFDMIQKARIHCIETVTEQYEDHIDTTEIYKLKIDINGTEVD